MGQVNLKVNLNVLVQIYKRAEDSLNDVLNTLKSSGYNKGDSSNILENARKNERHSVKLLVAEYDRLAKITNDLDCCPVFCEEGSTAFVEVQKGGWLD